MEHPWLKPHKNGSLLRLYVQPGASKSEIVGTHDGRLKVKISAPPVDGAANEAVIKFLAEYFKVGKSKVHLVRGESSRQKELLVELSPAEITSVFSC